ncbi:replication initiation protein [Vibrio aerogenes]|uniref:replication initiation protein n=1 Tax=Vibrio aerogenes TaxID=92172 RepID=UPI0021C2838C|nr:replication initiation protein [Vibrio aerogenes]
MDISTAYEEGVFAGERSNIDRLLSRAPYYPRCSWDKTASKSRPTELAFKMPYIQIQPTAEQSWLVFDLDHNNPFIWQDANLPPPNLIVSNRNNGHAHLYYAISKVCKSEKADPKIIRYKENVYKAMAQRLKADPCYTGFISKTPFHSWWRTSELHTQQYNLGDLAASVTSEISQIIARDNTSSSKAVNPKTYAYRNPCLFDVVRNFAYSIVRAERAQENYSGFYKEVESYALEQNTKFVGLGWESNLPESEVHHTVKSIVNWTWNRYTGNRDCNRGVMNLESVIPLKAKQRLAARYSARTKSEKTLRRIKMTIQNIRQKGDKVTCTLIAKTLGISRQTVSKYMPEAEHAQSNIVSLHTLFHLGKRKLKKVNLGVHQISSSFKSWSFFAESVCDSVNCHKRVNFSSGGFYSFVCLFDHDST